ncbi:histidine kinase [Fictibacillus enclensis]|uniref:sensor histidine kinase n=1 Tax=Fictibacillus enclensis TaxID=1017270 RepID=UPI0025A0E237|nr:sensor histidine kinase [Fictibacillus enclensis]MDM5196666.1 histidine kinase [Fictibacillus enclensis]
MTLQNKLIISFILFILLPLFGTGIYAYSEFEKMLREQAAVSAADRLHQVNLNMERKLSAMMNVSNAIVLDNDVRKILKNPPVSPREKLDAASVIDQKYLEVNTAILSDEVFLSLTDNSGHLYSNWGSPDKKNLVQTPWYKKALNNNGFMVWVLNHKSYIDGYQKKMISVALEIKDRDLSKPLGVLVVSEPVDNYNEILQVNNRQINRYGFVSNGKELLGFNNKQPNLLYKELKPLLKKENGTFEQSIDGEKSTVSTYTILLTGWRLVHVIPHSSLFTDINKLRNNVLLIMAISLMVFAALIIFISSMFTKPLRELEDRMKEVEDGRLNVRIPSTSNDEVGRLGKSFNRMITELNISIEKLVESEKNRQKAKLEALQSQIHPHFLNNTLNTIKWMSIMAGTQPITEMLLSLGRLLDMSIHRGQDIISLKDEMENVEAFLTIQKYRFGDDIFIMKEISEATLDCQVPNLSLQPLVENVYHHGLFLDKGNLLIKSSVKDDELHIEVIDDGRLEHPEELQSIDTGLNSDQPTFSIGLRNVHQRIQMLYGKEYGVQITRNVDEQKTYSIMKLPVRRITNEDENHRY